MENAPKKRKRLSTGKKVAIGIFAAVWLVILAGIGYLYHTFSLMNHTEKPEEKPVAAETTESDNDPGSLQWDSANQVYYDDNVINILLIGQDTRDGTRQRSDSMIIATINQNTKEVILTSLMRDLYVDIPGRGGNRINAAFAFGGSQLLDQTIESNFNIRIDANAVVDFEGFQRVIDSIGGIDIELYQEEVDYLGYNDLSVGMNHLNGEQALAYARIRYVGNNDYERTERQRRVLMAAFKQVKNQGVMTSVSMINELFPLVTTDLSTMDIIRYAGTVLSMNVDTVRTYRIPMDGEFSNDTIRGMMVLVPDLNQCRASMLKAIYGVENIQTGILAEAE